MTARNREKERIWCKPKDFRQHNFQSVYKMAKYYKRCLKIQARNMRPTKQGEKQTLSRKEKYNH